MVNCRLISRGILATAVREFSRASLVRHRHTVRILYSALPVPHEEVAAGYPSDNALRGLKAIVIPRGPRMTKIATKSLATFYRVFFSSKVARA